MAGGVGSRFWPFSRTNKPKQFLDFLGTGRSLLQMTFERFRGLIPTENIYIVSNQAYRDLILEQLPELKPEQVLLEPLRRNTAPCIAYAVHKIKARTDKATILVVPSDHLITNEDVYVRVLREGLTFAQNNNALLTLGMKPTRPETGYGYIQIGEGGGLLRKVKTFTEKPNLEMAKIFVSSGEFYWNSGIFIWSLSSIDNAFKTYLPEVHSLFQANSNESIDDFISDTYSNCPNISIDVGIMEKAQNVYIHESDFGWSDLGTWGSLYENTAHDSYNNTIIGKDVFSYDTKNCIINVPKNKISVIQKLDGYIVADSGESLLICKKEDEQKIRQYVNDIKLKKGENYV